MKCDGGRPSCQRCSSTGRKCDGYGIWGGGGLETQRPAVQASPKLDQMSILGLVSSQECRYFDWFQCRTATKLPGIFGSPFWERLVLQASLTEPAVLHAALALGSAHRSSPSMQITKRSSVPDEQEQFTLRHYSKAIRHLRPRVDDHSKASLRVALVSCALFVCLEFLSGRYQTGYKHMRSGIDLLREMKQSSDTACEAHSQTNLFNASVDNWLSDVFSRLSLSAILLGNDHPAYNPILMLPGDCGPPPPIFENITQARRRLDHLMGDVLLLSDHCRLFSHGTHSVELPQEAFSTQNRILSDLDAWNTAYTASRVQVVAEMGAHGEVAYPILHRTHTFVRLMTATCLLNGNEMGYDEHMSSFLEIIRYSVDLLVSVADLQRANKAYVHRTDVPPFVADRGWILPLYFTALRCRNHRIRLQAVQLLHASKCREGIWDSEIAASMSKEVMNLEEGSFYDDCHWTDGFSYIDMPTEEDLNLSTLPSCRRFTNVEAILPDGPSDAMTLVCKQKGPDGRFKLLRRRFDPNKGYWMSTPIVGELTSSASNCAHTVKHELS